MTDKKAKNNWITNDEARAAFWVAVQEHLGHLDDSHAAAHNACAVSSMKDFEGSRDDAIALVMEFAAADAEYQEQEALAGIKTISVTYERKFNLGDYNSLHIGMTTWADVHDNTTAEKVQAALWEWVKDAVKEQALPVINATKKPTGPTKKPSAPSPAPTSSPAPPTPPPTPGNTPPPSSAQPTAPPAGSDGGGSETFSVESITAQVSPNGNRYYAVRGGRVKKHGATAWPEIAEPQLETLTEYNPVNLEIGKPWDVTGFDIRAVGEIPAGKTYPNKVTTFVLS